VSHISIAEKVARDLNLDIQFKVLGWREPGHVYAVGANVDVVQLRARDILKPSGLFAAVRGCDLVLDISAGDSFTDIYGARRFLLGVLSKIVVLAAHRTLVLSPQTVGPFERPWAQHIARALMRQARKIVTRDALSSKYLNEMGLGDNLVEATDVAFRLPYDPPPEHAPSPVRVGLNVSGLLFNGGYTRDDMFALAADYPALVRALCVHFAALPGCQLHLIGHVNSRTHSVEDDYRVAEALAAEFPGALLAPRFASPSAAKSYIATMDFFAGARMHACIAAFSSGVPVVPMAYSRKFAGVFGTLGYDVLADCRSQGTDEIVRIVVEAFEQREQLRSAVEAGRRLAEEKLLAYEIVLRECFRELACQRR
jgi:polysaccharide pyruvyl transferase WcaK-like protein